MPLIETTGAASARGFGQFARVAAPVYIEDVMSVFLYTGNGSTQTITNGIDLAGKGGLVWTKGRSGTTYHVLTDTVRGAAFGLASNVPDADNNGSYFSGFNSTGYGINNVASINTNAATYASWTFRKQAKFFDVVTYTGNATGPGSSQTINHNLNSVPGLIIVKQTNTTRDWAVWHRSLANTEYLTLNSTQSVQTDTEYWKSTTPTASSFTVGNSGNTNANGGTYVAYLFAHDAGGFGQSGSDNVISCGSFTTAASGYSSISLGYEPQWLLIKTTGVSQNWFVFDNMRGFVVTGNSPSLSPNTSAAEDTSVSNAIRPTATGFDINADYFGGSRAYIYIAIRRGPMKTPTTGTSVFAPTTRAGTGATATVNTGILTDAVWETGRSGQTNFAYDRLRGVAKQMTFTSTNGESTYTPTDTLTGFDSMTGFVVGADTSSYINGSGINYIYWNFRRAPGFFDVVCYTGNATARSITHNLGVAPEFIIIKNRSATWDWQCRHSGFGVGQTSIQLNSTAAAGNLNLITSLGDASTFSINDNSQVNGSSNNLVAYLFATCPGVSKVGSYTGTGNTLQIDCGFTGGVSFVLIKRTDSTGDWYVWDSARGIVAGNDPYLLLNSTAAEVTTTDWVDTYSAGFELSNAGGNNANINTATYIFLAIA